MCGTDTVSWRNVRFQRMIICWSQILRQQPDWWLKLISRDWRQKQTNISSYKSQRKAFFSIIDSTFHFLTGADFVLTKAAGVVYFQNSKHTSLFHETSLNINILFVNWIYWTNKSYIAQSNDSKWIITPLCMRGGMFCKCKLKLEDKHGMGYLECRIALIELGF